MNKYKLMPKRYKANIYHGYTPEGRKVCYQRELMSDGKYHIISYPESHPTLSCSAISKEKSFKVLDKMLNDFKDYWGIIT